MLHCIARGISTELLLLLQPSNRSSMPHAGQHAASSGDKRAANGMTHDSMLLPSNFIIIRAYSCTFHAFCMYTAACLTRLQQLRAATAPISLAQHLRSYMRSLLFGYRGLSVLCASILLAAALIGVSMGLGRFGDCFLCCCH